ncbi:gliding motility-associated C-terminal domain-containing protein [Arenibacter palladensis]|uniref:Gliding motility-associated C-terminal domain-containing protein n=1 Tax=Arenibacter palladensis TaxID=237373 RepID=A0A1M4VEX8_9FLAO|nr:T9SS type B sorting domain-containing protein [Arenibacter palladensis]SHE67507.1 gliding motility-associated C-terminal domain-containing protein [Arenibacter palladensis]
MNHFSGQLCIKLLIVVCFYSNFVLGEFRHNTILTSLPLFSAWDETESNQGSISRHTLAYSPHKKQTITIPKTLNTVAQNCRVQTVVYDEYGNTSFPRCETAPPTSIRLQVNSTIIRSSPQQTENFKYVNKWQKSTDGRDWEDAISNVPGLGNRYIIPSSSTNYRFYRYVLIDEELPGSLCNFDYQVYEIFNVPQPDPPLSLGNIEACRSENRMLTVSIDEEVEWYEDLTVDWYDEPIGGNLLLANSTTLLALTSGTYYAEARAFPAPLGPPVPGSFVHIPDSILSCSSSQRTAVSIIVHDDPPTPTDETLSFCENTTITLSSDTSNVDYKWSTGETTSDINVSIPGIYTVTLTNGNGCSTTKTITLNQIDTPKIKTAISEEYTLTIIMDNNGDFEYSLDGYNYQDDNQFTNTEGGLYTLFARVKNNCGTANLPYVHLVIPKFFTPNGDGIHDTFKISGAENLKPAQLSIFDRYGNLLKTTMNSPFEWDGSYHGRELPASDYWFQFKVNNNIKKGHFALKR